MTDTPIDQRKFTDHEVREILRRAVKNITFWSKDGKTTIRASANLNNAVALTFVPAGAIGLITSIIGLVEFLGDGSELGLTIFLAAIFVLYPILRKILNWVTSSESAKLERAVAELARLAEGSAD